MKKNIFTIILLTTIAGAVLATDYPAPEKTKLTVVELKEALSDYTGKVVKVEANGFTGLRQEGKGEYTVFCSCYENHNWRLLARIQVYFSEEKGKKFFEKLVEKNDGSNLWGEMKEHIFVYVESHEKLIALGKRYRSDTKEYRW
jgi:hypothetical protein